MGLCTCDTVEKIRITNEYFGSWDEMDGMFRPRCGACGGKLQDYPIPAEVALLLPDPDDVPEHFVEKLGEEFLDVDSDDEFDPGVTVTVTVQDPRCDVDSQVEVSIDWWDNPHRLADEAAVTP